MKTMTVGLVLAVVMAVTGRSEGISLESAPPVVVHTVPAAGTMNVDPALTELEVTFSKPMMDGSWSWSTWGEENFPKVTGDIHYRPDGRTCVLPVKLEPGKFYATWLNSSKFHNFQDADGRPAVPYLLTFQTAGSGGTGSRTEATGAAKPDASLDLLNADQRAVLEWTDRQFRGFFDRRNFESWPEAERTALQQRLLDRLNGPQDREYYQAINTLGALGGTNAVPALLSIATDHAEKDCRDRWMATRALGLLRDKQVVPNLIPLVYHGNANTRWWAQISLVRLTGTNFGGNWEAWGNWWNEQGGQPVFQPEIIRWWSQQPEPDKLEQSLAESDRSFLAGIQKK